MAEIRHYQRFKDYDYSRGAALFITVTTSPRRQIFGRVTNGKMVLSDLGQEADTSIKRVFNSAAITLHRHVVMPDHVHISIYLRPGLDNPAAIALLNRTVGKFKSWINRCWWQHGGEGALWQQGYHDWLCIGREMIDSVQRYIDYNPLKWELRNNRSLLRMVEPINSPLLPAGEYWRGIGALQVLNHERELVALRISRTNTPAQLSALCARMAPKIGQYAFISGFISAGERQVLELLLESADSQIIKVSPYAFPHDYNPPVTWMKAIDDGRMAVIARGNSPEELNRASCLDLNAAIARMADKTAYYKAGSFLR